MVKWGIRLIYGIAVVLFVVLCTMFWNQHQAIALAGKVMPELTYGPADAKLTVVEFMDYRCAACRDNNPIVQKIIKEYPDVRFVIRHFPIYNEPSIFEADIALTAARHGKFKEAHELLTSREEPVEVFELSKILSDLDINMAADKFREEMRSAENGEILLQTLDITERLNINSAPSFLIGRAIYKPQSFPMDEDDFRNHLNKALGRKPVPRKITPPDTAIPEAAKPEAATPEAALPADAAPATTGEAVTGDAPADTGADTNDGMDMDMNADITPPADTARPAQ